MKGLTFSRVQDPCLKVIHDDQSWPTVAAKCIKLRLVAPIGKIHQEVERIFSDDKPLDGSRGEFQFLREFLVILSVFFIDQILISEIFKLLCEWKSNEDEKIIQKNTFSS